MIEEDVTKEKESILQLRYGSVLILDDVESNLHDKTIEYIYG